MTPTQSFNSNGEKNVQPYKRPINWLSFGLASTAVVLTLVGTALGFYLNDGTDEKVPAPSPEISQN